MLRSPHHSPELVPSPRPLQPGCYYHIFNRGNNRENIFIEGRNYDYFINLYVRYIQSVTDTYAYCLMRNHFHLLVRVKDERETLKVSKTFRVFADASQAFSNLFNAYAKAINKAYGRTGSLFEHPFGREVVASDSYFARLVLYIHYNPQKHGFVNDFRSWPYSSYKTILSTAPTFLQREDVLEWFGGRQGFKTFHQNEAYENNLNGLALIDNEP